MRRALTVALLLLAAGVPATAGAVSVREDGPRVLLANGLVEYEFRADRQYDLVGVRPAKQKESLLVAGAHLVYCEEGVWKRECGASPESKESAGFGEYRAAHWAEEKRGVLRLSTQSDRLRLQKTFVLEAESPALRVSYRIEATAPHAISNGYTTLIWLDGRAKTWLRPENEVRGGRVVERIVSGPFRTVTVGNQPVSMQPESWVGCYDAAMKAGILAISAPGELLPFRAGEQGSQGFIGLAFRNFAPGDPARGIASVLTGTFTLVPFAGDPMAAIPDLVKRFGKAETGTRFPAKFESGRRLPAPGDAALWWDLPTNKIFRDEPVPSARSAAVELRAARNEVEPFQLVVRPAADLAGVTLQATDLVRAGEGRPEAGVRAALTASAAGGGTAASRPPARGRIPAANVEWNPLGYYACGQPVDATGFSGEVPDALLPPAPTACRAGRCQPFWVTVRVPADAAPGEYRGSVRVLSGAKVLVTVPVVLHVWDFALPEERSLTAFCPLWKNHVEKHYGQERASQLWPRFLEHLAAHRVGMLHPEATPVAKWDEKGALVSCDFEAFDRAMEEAFARDKLRRIVLGGFTIGYGHVPRANRFGTAEEILSPLWRARCESYARALAAHLRERGWQERVVFSLFDEPEPKYYPLIRDTVALLKAVEPSWRFTYWGVYAPGLEGAIQVWTVPASDYSPSLAARARARGEEVWVYNPDGYCVGQSAMAVRANYWWAWRQGIPVVFQWTTNAWIEWTGSTTLWDPQRNASWVLPGEEGPMGTLRLELTREGMEDFEYLALLSRLVATAEKRGVRAPALAAGKDALVAAREIAATPASEKVALLYTPDQRVLHATRERLGSAIEALAKALGK